MRTSSCPMFSTVAVNHAINTKGNTMKPKLPKARVMYVRADSLSRIYDEAVLHARSTDGTLKQPVAVIPATSRASASRFVKVAGFFSMTEEEQVEKLAKVVERNINNHGMPGKTSRAILATIRGGAK